MYCRNVCKTVRSFQELLYTEINTLISLVRPVTLLQCRKNILAAKDNFIFIKGAFDNTSFEVTYTGLGDAEMIPSSADESILYCMSGK